MCVITLTNTAHHNRQTNVPWEFENPLARSYSAADVVCGIPMMLGAEDNALANIKWWSLGLSLLGDLLTFRVFNQVLETPAAVWDAMLIRATSWPVVVFTTKTFSNTLEACLVDAMLGLALQRNIGLIDLLLGGVLLGWGIFVRITFPAFVFPIVCFVLWHKWLDGGWGLLLQAVCLAGVGFILAVGFSIAYDSYVVGYFSISPLALLQYNWETENLALHGLHPRWTHFVVNLQILFGPFAIVAAIAARTMNNKQGLKLVWAVIICGIAVLSAFQHQELRYLLPIVTPMTLIFQKYHIVSKYRITLAMWLMLNLALGWFFGFAHQGGVVQGVMRAPQFCDTGCCLIGYNVYSIPRYLLGSHSKRFTSVGNLDESEKGAFELIAGCETIIVVHPQSKSFNRIASNYGFANISLTPRWHYSGYHFNGEIGGFDTLVMEEFERSSGGLDA